MTPTMPPNAYTRGEAVYQRSHVWTDDQGITHGLIDLGSVEVTFHDPAQVRDLIAHLAILAHEMDTEAGRQEQDGGEGEPPVPWAVRQAHTIGGAR